MSRQDIIWSNDIDDLWSDEDYQRDQYEAYLDQFEWSRPKEEIDPSVLTRSNYDDEYVDPDEEQPLSFEEWLEDYFYTDYVLMNIEAEYAKEDLENNVCPMIEKQLNYNILVMAGSRSGWRAGSGVMVFDGTDGFVDYIYDRNYDNYSELTKNEDGSIHYSTADHDGSTSGDLYTITTDREALLNVAVANGYMDEETLEDYRDYYSSSMSDEDIAIELLEDDIADEVIPKNNFKAILVPIRLEW